MIIKADNNSYFVFDLDDTLYLEMDFLKSAFNAIAFEISPDIGSRLYEEMINIFLEGGNTFNFLLEKFREKNLTVEKLLYLYRNHYPDISLRDGVLNMIEEIKNRKGKIGIITDGRKITQRNKIKGLGLVDHLDKIVISEEFGAEKPASALYKSFMDADVEKQYYYFGDNLTKDFVAPKKLGWCCIGILDNNNIHRQNISEFSSEYLPHIFVNKFTEIGII